MLERGHINYSIRKIFIKESVKAIKSKIPLVTKEPPTYISNNHTLENNNIYIHISHHPNNLIHKELQSLTNILKEEIKEEFESNQVIIAYSKAPNIGDICKKHQLEYYIDTHHPSG